jgi:hypothetical protein
MSISDNSKRLIMLTPAQKNQVELLKFHNFLNASFDFFIYNREKPVEVAVEKGHLEASPYIIEKVK